MSREELLAEGFVKIVQQFDDLESSREGAGQRDNAAHLIRKHLEDVGLDGDIAQYNEISGLSGGQKMKLVIAACMWNNPQILILDEPTNFIDRDSLGGLAVAIKEWAGAVCIISHSKVFRFLSRPNLITYYRSRICGSFMPGTMARRSWSFDTQGPDQHC